MRCEGDYTLDTHRETHTERHTDTPAAKGTRKTNTVYLLLPSRGAVKLLSNGRDPTCGAVDEKLAVGSFHQGGRRLRALTSVAVLVLSVAALFGQFVGLDLNLSFMALTVTRTWSRCFSQDAQQREQTDPSIKCANWGVYYILYVVFTGAVCFEA